MEPKVRKYILVFLVILFFGGFGLTYGILTLFHSKACNPNLNDCDGKIKIGVIQDEYSERFFDGCGNERTCYRPVYLFKYSDKTCKFIDRDVSYHTKNDTQFKHEIGYEGKIYVYGEECTTNIHIYFYEWCWSSMVLSFAVFLFVINLASFGYKVYKYKYKNKQPKQDEIVLI